MSPQLASKTLSVRETAELLGVHVITIYKSIDRGELPVIRLGRRCLVPRAPIEELLAHGSRRPSDGADDRKRAGATK